MTQHPTISSPSPSPHYLSGTQSLLHFYLCHQGDILIWDLFLAERSTAPPVSAQMPNVPFSGLIVESGRTSHDIYSKFHKPLSHWSKKRETTSRVFTHERCGGGWREGGGGSEEDSQSEHKVTAAERRKNDSAQIVDLSFWLSVLLPAVFGLQRPCSWFVVIRSGNTTADGNAAVMED